MEKANPQLEASWKNRLSVEFDSPYFIRLKEFLINEKSAGNTIYPRGSRIFAAFDQTPFESVKVVLLGQDPYHGPGQAHGLCFSVPEGIPIPPSLQNIFKELHMEYGWGPFRHGDLSKWADQGVLLLNATLTVRANQAGSHQKQGWEDFTNAVIRRISDEKDGVVFLLWGKYAQAKAELIDSTRHHVLKAPHPSPLSAYQGFFGCDHFKKTNDLLVKAGKSPIDWRLDD